MSTKLKLIIIFVVSMLLSPVLITLSGIFLFQLPTKLSFLIGLLPVVLTVLIIVWQLIACFIKSGSKQMLANLKNVFVHLKYNPRFPVYFYYAPDPPKKYKFRLPENKLLDLKAGDVLLRRVENSLIGLILEQTTYYTHAAIFVKEENGALKVYEAVSDGVRVISINDFIKCDDFVVLRPVHEQLYEGRAKVFPYSNRDTSSIPNFSRSNNINTDGIRNLKKVFQKLRDLIKAQEGIFDPNPKRIKDLRKHMEEMYEEDQPCNEWHKKQGALYDELLRIHNSGQQYTTSYSSNDKFIDIACGMAKCLKKRNTPYDFLFNFTDFRKLSCIEYVWVCYWGMYPIHHIHRKKYNYFSWIEVLVLVPDLFLKSNFFESVYPSNEKKEELPKLNYWCQFLARQFLCLFLLLIIVAAIYFVAVNILSS